jgi:hypothetical protein
MAKRGLDWKLLIVLAAAGAIFVTAVLILHRWRRSFQPQTEATAVISTVR